MPRIRTIKPQFWTDEKVGKLSLGARLLYIGTWNLADDEGILMWDAKYLKGQIFPYDNFAGHINRWMKELEDSGMVRPYTTEGQSHLALIPSMARHQVISRPQPSRFELPVGFADFVPKYTPYSRNNHGALMEHSMNTPCWNKEEGKGISNKEMEKDTTPISPSTEQKGTLAASSFSSENKYQDKTELMRIPYYTVGTALLVAEKKIEALPENREIVIAALKAKGIPFEEPQPHELSP